MNDEKKNFYLHLVNVVIKNTFILLILFSVAQICGAFSAPAVIAVLVSICVQIQLIYRAYHASGQQK